MAHQRAKDQTTDAFSLPVALYDRAVERARQLGMSRSGYYRYALALELRYPEAEARKLATHMALFKAARQPVRYRGGGGGSVSLVLNDDAPASLKKLAALPRQQLESGHLPPAPEPTSDKCEPQPAVSKLANRKRIPPVAAPDEHEHES